MILRIIIVAGINQDGEKYRYILDLPLSSTLESTLRKIDPSILDELSNRRIRLNSIRKVVLVPGEWLGE